VSARKPNPKPRSGCPIGISLDLFGDRWSLLIVRDMMVRGLRTFSEFQHSGEEISTNILADRLRHLEACGIIAAERATEDGRRINYRLTAKGIALAPMMLELFIWAAHHESTGAPASMVKEMEQNRGAILAETYRRWQQRDSTPLIPPFTSRLNSRKDTGDHETEHLSELPRQLRRGARVLREKSRRQTPLQNNFR